MMTGTQIRASGRGSSSSVGTVASVEFMAPSSPPMQNAKTRMNDSSDAKSAVDAAIKLSAACTAQTEAHTILRPQRSASHATGIRHVHEPTARRTRSASLASASLQPQRSIPSRTTWTTPTQPPVPKRKVITQRRCTRPSRSTLHRVGGAAGSAAGSSAGLVTVTAVASFVFSRGGVSSSAALPRSSASAPARQSSTFRQPMAAIARGNTGPSTSGVSAPPRLATACARASLVENQRVIITIGEKKASDWPRPHTSPYER